MTLYTSFWKHWLWLSCGFGAVGLSLKEIARQIEVRVKLGA